MAEVNEDTIHPIAPININFGDEREYLNYIFYL